MQITSTLLCLNKWLLEENVNHQVTGQMLRSRYRNYSELKGLVVLSQACQNLVHIFLPVTLQIFTKKISSKFFIASPFSKIIYRL